MGYVYSICVYVCVVYVGGCVCIYTHFYSKIFFFTPFYISNANFFIKLIYKKIEIYFYYITTLHPKMLLHKLYLYDVENNTHIITSKQIKLYNNDDIFANYPYYENI